MKHLFTLIPILFSATLFAQSAKIYTVYNEPSAASYFFNLIRHSDNSEVKPCEYWVSNPCVYNPANGNDTLIVPAGKYQFIKIGDKIYKINYSLEEVQPAQTDTTNYWKGGITSPFILQNGSYTPIYRGDIIEIPLTETNK